MADDEMVMIALLEVAPTALEANWQMARCAPVFMGRYCYGDGRSWWSGTVVERRSLTGELSLSCARPAADG